MLKQKTSITVDRLPTEENKRLFSVFVCSKEIEVCHCCFPFAENKQKLPFFVSSVFYLWNSGNMETCRVDTWRHGDIETWGDGDMGTWRCVDMEMWRHGDVETWRH